MKKLFFIPAIFFTLQAFAQEPYYDFKKFKENMNGGILLPLDKNKQSEIISKDSLQKLIESFEKKQYSPNIGELILTQPNGTRVYALPGDHMPCLVPDPSRFNYHMPVAGTGIKITGMPPRSLPKTIIPGNKNKKPLP